MRLFSTLWCVFLILGCASKGHEPFEPPEFEKKVVEKKVWKTSIGPGANTSTLISAFDDFVCGASDHKVLCLDLRDGKPVIERDVTDVITAGITFDRAGILYGTSLGDFVLLSLDGGLKWSVNLGKEPVGLPVVTGKMVSTKTADGSIIALGLEDGVKLWEFSSPQKSLILRQTSGIRIGPDGNFVSGFPDGNLYKFDATSGALMWKQIVSVPSGDNEVERLSDVVGTPIVIDDVICASSYQGQIACLKYQSGKPVWSQRVSAVGSLASDGSRVFVTDSNSVIFCYDVVSGRQLWRQDMLKYRNLTGPVTHLNFVLVGDFSGSVFALDKMNGNLIGKFAIGDGAVEVTPLIVSGQMVVKTSSGNFSASILELSVK